MEKLQKIAKNDIKSLESEVLNLLKREIEKDTMPYKFGLKVRNGYEEGMDIENCDIQLKGYMLSKDSEELFFHISFYNDEDMAVFAKVYNIGGKYYYDLYSKLGTEDIPVSIGDEL